MDQVADALALVPKGLPRCASERLQATIFALLDCSWRGCTGPSTNRSDCDRNHHNRESREKDAGEQPSIHDNLLLEDALCRGHNQPLARIGQPLKRRFSFPDHLVGRGLPPKAGPERRLTAPVIALVVCGQRYFWVQLERNGRADRPRAAYSARSGSRPAVRVKRTSKRSSGPNPVTVLEEAFRV